MTNKLKPKSEFSRNVLTLMTGTTIAQAIPIAISPILTRIYTPEDFGVLALFVSITSIFGSIANGRYELAIMLPKKDEDAINILALGFIINIVLSLTLLLVVLIFHDSLLSLLNNDDISPWLYLVPISVFLMGCFNLLNYFNNRKKLYKDLAKANVTKSIAMAVIQLSFGFLKAGAFGLISGQLASQIASNTKLYINLKKENLFKYITKNKIYILSKEHKKLPIFNLPNALIDGIRMTMITILISKFFSISLLGQFSLAWRIIQTPMSLVGSSLSQVFFQKISTAKKEDIYEIVILFIKKALLVAFPLFIFIYFFAESIFGFVFGEKWKIAGEVASIMTPWLFLNFLTSPLSTLFIRLNKQEILLIFAFFYALIPILIIYFFHEKGFLSVLNILSWGMFGMLSIFMGLLFFITKGKI